jgi:hypothetical protein
MTKEIYKDIQGYEGIYQVSNLGNVKRINNKNNKNELVLKQFYNVRGYYQIGLYFNNKQKYYYVHRLIAQAFIPNPNNYPIINHINGIKSDNSIGNLEWCTYLHNIRHAFSTGLNIAPIGDNHKRSKKIIDTKTGEIYHSAITLSKKLGVKRETLRSWLNNNRPNKTSFRYL